MDTQQCSINVAKERSNEAQLPVPSTDPNIFGEAGVFKHHIDEA